MRRLRNVLLALLLLGFGLNGVVGLWILPPMLLQGPLPRRTEAGREAIRTALRGDGIWSCAEVVGGEGRVLDVWRLVRPGSHGVVVYLHGFGDDAWGTLRKAADLPDWDAVGFTFRGRDRHPEVPCTLGGWERWDGVAVVRWLEGQGVPRSRIVLAGWSMGAGTALLSLAELEAEGGPLGGALLECPFTTLEAAARDHLRLSLGRFEGLLRPAEALAFWRAGRIARFRPQGVDAVKASVGLATPIALLTGDADRETPLPGVRAIARQHPDLTVVPGAGHCQAGGRLAGGWKGWAEERLRRWGFNAKSQPKKGFTTEFTEEDRKEHTEKNTKIQML